MIGKWVDIDQRMCLGIVINDVKSIPFKIDDEEIDVFGVLGISSPPPLLDVSP
jgi:hypothetical protein